MIKMCWATRKRWRRGRENGEEDKRAEEEDDDDDREEADEEEEELVVNFDVLHNLPAAL